MEIEHANTQKELDKKDSVGKITGFFLFRNLIENYNTLKSSPEEERKKIKRYGILSLILSIISLLLSLANLFSRLFNLEIFGGSYVIMLIIYIFSGIIVSLILSIYGFVFGVLQVRLNRKSIGIFGLILSVASICLVIVLIVFLFL